MFRHSYMSQNSPYETSRDWSTEIERVLLSDHCSTSKLPRLDKNIFWLLDDFRCVDGGLPYFANLVSFYKPRNTWNKIRSDKFLNKNYLLTGSTKSAITNGLRSEHPKKIPTKMLICVSVVLKFSSVTASKIVRLLSNSER